MPLVDYRQFDLKFDRADIYRVSDINNHLIVLLKTAVKHEASDLHLKANSRAFLRIKGKLIPCGSDTISSEQLREMIMSTMSEDQRELFYKLKEVDYGLRIPNVGRFRVNAYTAQGEVEAVLRVIQEGARNTENLKLPPVINKLAAEKDGLVLVAGSTGSGKSTTLAAMIDYVNKNYPKRIITIENPVEILHNDVKSVISQREVGGDTDSFASALRSILRQNPDIILIGEIRDRETADSALQAAQTGHLVFSTIHAGTAEETISRFAGLYPADERPGVKRSLAYSLKGVLAQRLIVDKTGSKLPVLEIMTSTDRITQAMLADADDQPGKESITKVIAESELYGMMTLDQYLLKLVVNKVITVEAAIAESVNPLTFRQTLHQRNLI